MSETTIFMGLIIEYANERFDLSTANITDICKFVGKHKKDKRSMWYYSYITQEFRSYDPYKEPFVAFDHAVLLMFDDFKATVAEIVDKEAVECLDFSNDNRYIRRTYAKNHKYEEMWYDSVATNEYRFLDFSKSLNIPKGVVVVFRTKTA